MPVAYTDWFHGRWNRVRYTLRYFGGRHPLCGIGVTSWIDRTRIPALAIARIAESRPLPGPFTRTSTVRIPLATAARAADSPARWAANAVFLREPRNAIAPELLCATTLPSVSVKVISVLLNVAMMYARPCGTNFRSRLRRRDLGMVDSIPNT